MTDTVIRPYTVADRPGVERVFGATLFGDAARQLYGLAPYREACLAWYLGPGRRDAAVAVDPVLGVVGYAFVCIDGIAAGLVARYAGRRLARHVMRGALTGRLNQFSRAFYRGRIRDARALHGVSRHPPADVHAHLNVLAGSERSRTVIRLVAHVDRVCRRNGSPSWYGEINERRGRRTLALERLGFEIVGREPNHTLTAVTGQEVERLVVLRDLANIDPARDPITRIAGALGLREHEPTGTAAAS